MFNRKMCNSQVYNQSLEIVGNSSKMEFSLHTHTVLSPFCKINCCECEINIFVSLYASNAINSFFRNIKCHSASQKNPYHLWNLRFLTMFITCCHWLYTATLAIHCPRFLLFLHSTRKILPALSIIIPKILP